MSEHRLAVAADGTRLAYRVAGRGRPILLIGGAFNDHTTMAALADVLAAARTVVTYDRRGRGDSEAGPLLRDDRALAGVEIGDAGAVIAAAADEVPTASVGWQVFGHSSGAVLALRLATEGGATDRVTRVSAYEPTWIVPGTRPAPPDDYRDGIRAAVQRDDRDAAVASFLETSVLVPAPVVRQMAGTPRGPG